MLAAVIWIGGMLFLTLVLVPASQSMEPQRRGVLLADLGKRFRLVGWTCILTLVATGLINLNHRGISPADLFTGAFLSERRGVVLLTKLSMIAAMIVLSAVHDLVLGPQLTQALRTGPQHAARLRRRTSWLARANLALGLAVLMLAILLVRG